MITILATTLAKTAAHQLTSARQVAKRTQVTSYQNITDGKAP
jgi:hypothetical protein